MLLDGVCGREFGGDGDVVLDIDNHITPWSTAVSQLWPSPTAAPSPDHPRDCSFSLTTAAPSPDHPHGGSFSQPASCYASTGFLKEQIGALLQPSDNRLATKLFGNSRALTKEKLRQKATGRWIVHPCSNFR